MARLRAVPGVTVVPKDQKLKDRHTASRIWNETWLAAFFHKPCNHELFVLQSLNMEGAHSQSRPQNKLFSIFLLAAEEPGNAVACTGSSVNSFVV